MNDKYNYETSFEGAIKQGIPKNEYARESSKNCILTWIANEQARANELKILELRIKITESTDIDTLKFKGLLSQI